MRHVNNCNNGFRLSVDSKIAAHKTIQKRKRIHKISEKSSTIVSFLHTARTHAATHVILLIYFHPTVKCKIKPYQNMPD